MINLIVEKMKYKVPSKLIELTIGRYQKLKGLDQTNQTKYFGELLNKLGDVPYEVILNMTHKDVKDVAESLIVMLAGGSESLQNYINIKGVTYKFTENLDLMRFDQFIDLTEMTDDPVLINDNMHLIPAILYQEVIGKKKTKFIWYKFWKKRAYVDIVEPYTSEAIYKRSKIFKEYMTMDVVYGLLIFFSHLKVISMRNSLVSLQTQLAQTENQKTMEE